MTFRLADMAANQVFGTSDYLSLLFCARKTTLLMKELKT